MAQRQRERLTQLSPVSNGVWFAVFAYGETQSQPIELPSADWKAVTYVERLVAWAIQETIDIDGYGHIDRDTLVTDVVGLIDVGGYIDSPDNVDSFIGYYEQAQLDDANVTEQIRRDAEREIIEQRRRLTAKPTIQRDLVSGKC